VVEATTSVGGESGGRDEATASGEDENKSADLGHAISFEGVESAGSSG
jgi:hypothetical protein